MRYLADLPEAQVAAALGCSVGTVKQHAPRGLAALRLALASPTARAIVAPPISQPTSTLPSTLPSSPEGAL